MEFIWDIFILICLIYIFVVFLTLPGRVDKIAKTVELLHKQLAAMENQLADFTQPVWRIDSVKRDYGMLTFAELQALAVGGKITKRTLLLKTKLKPGTTDSDGEQKIFAEEVDSLRGILSLNEQ